MQVVPLAPSVLRVGARVPFALRDAQGMLLLAAGSVIETEAQRKQLLARGVWVNIVDSENFQRALAGKVASMVHQNASIGRIAEVKVEAPSRSPSPATAPSVPGAAGTPAPAVAPSPPPPAPAPVFRMPDDPVAAWQALAVRAGGLVRDPLPQDYVARLQRLDADMLDLLNGDPDVALLVLIQNAAADHHRYSVNHALLVWAVCELAARELPAAPVEQRRSLRCAALTMNIAMTTLQDQLAAHEGALSARQREAVEAHAAAGARQLAELGVADPLWLEAVEHHHRAGHGPLAELPEGQRLARLIRRADVFAARLSPRKQRPALSATSAVKGTYLDERGQPDEAGAAIVKATGIYPPGSAVQLASGELGVVLRRGARVNEPRVASLVSRSGTPLGEPVVRDTRLPAHEVKASIAPRELRLLVPLDRLTRL
jgi:HD-GYP domain-containing protein (c-di-GMP phosphodiesterase class II)